MARLLADSTINFTASSWKTIESASFQGSESNTVASTSSMQRTSTWTPGAGVVYEGILVKVSSRNASPSGTFSVELYNSTDSTQVKVVTCNVSDITGGTGSYTNGWVYFKFGSTYTTVAGKAYSCGFSTSGSGQVSLFRDATAANFSKGMVTSTTAAPGAGDELIIAGPITAAGTFTTATVTMDNTASTQFGHLSVADKGECKFGTSASTNYRLDLTGVSIAGNNVGLMLTGSGLLEIGNSSTRMPATSTGVINLVSTGSASTGNQFLIRSYSTFRAYGATKTRAAKAAADFSASATSITTNVSTAWKNTDLIGIGATARSATPSTETKALTADASGTTLTISAVGTGKSGTSPVQCDLINLSSNVRVYGSSTTNTGNINLAAGTANADCDNVEFRYLGSATSGFRGIDLAGPATSGSQSVTFKDCALYDFNSSAIFINVASTASDFDINGCVFYGTGNHINIGAVTSAAGTMKYRNCVSIGANLGAVFFDENLEITSNIFNGYTIGTAVTIAASSGLRTINANTVSCCSSTGLSIALRDSNIGTVTCYRNQVSGLAIANSARAVCTGATLFGNGTQNMFFNASNYANNVIFDQYDIQSGSGTTCPIGITISAGSYSYVYFTNSTIGTVTTHSTADVSVASSGGYGHQFVFRDCSAASTTVLASQSNLGSVDSIAFQRFGGTAGTHTTYYQYGKIDADSVIYDSSPRSMRLTPTSASNKLTAPVFLVNIPASGTATVSIKVRKSAAGDGAAYNGNQARIIMKANPAAGSSFDSDIVAMTSTNAANGAWETLTYTTPTATDSTAVQFVVDCDGTTGWVNVDTIGAS